MTSELEIPSREECRRPRRQQCCKAIRLKERPKLMNSFSGSFQCRSSYRLAAAGDGGTPGHWQMNARSHYHA